MHASFLEELEAIDTFIDSPLTAFEIEQQQTIDTAEEPNFTTFDLEKNMTLKKILYVTNPTSKFLENGADFSVVIS